MRKPITNLILYKKASWTPEIIHAPADADAETMYTQGCVLVDLCVVEEQDTSCFLLL